MRSSPRGPPRKTPHIAECRLVKRADHGLSAYLGGAKKHLLHFLQFRLTTKMDTLTIEKVMSLINSSDVPKTSRILQCVCNLKLGWLLSAPVRLNRLRLRVMMMLIGSQSRCQYDLYLPSSVRSVTDRWLDGCYVYQTCVTVRVEYET